MLVGLVVIVLAGACAVAAGYVLWWASHRSTVVNLFAGMLLALLAFAAAVFIGYLMMRFWIAPFDRL
jgi:hypothetical protein